MSELPDSMRAVSILEPGPPEVLQFVDDRARIAAQVAEHVRPLLANGTVKPVIDSTFALDRAAAAHRLMESGRHKGKIVLTCA